MGEQATDRTNVLREVAEWGVVTFPRSTDRSKFRHLLREVDELDHALFGGQGNVGEECADVAMLLAHIAHTHGYDLLAEVERKLAVCRTRTWGDPDADGVVEHVKAPAPEAAGR